VIFNFIGVIPHKKASINGDVLVLMQGGENQTKPTHQPRRDRTRALSHS